jgi:stage V sporulation protein S
MQGTVGVTSEEFLMRVSASSPVQAVANSIAKSIFESGHFPVIRAIGAGAVAQACKAIAIARGIVAPRGMDLSVVIGFDTIVGDTGDEISAQIFYLHAR